MGRAEAEHDGEVGHDLLLHLGCDLAAVEGVVVRVHQHGGEVTGDGGRMRRLQHLPGVAGMEVRVVIAHPVGELRKGGREPLVADL